MRKGLFVLGVVALAALLATSTFAANRGVSFTGIGFIHPWDPGPYPASMVWGMTDDGATLLTSPSWSGSYATLTTYPGLEWTLVGGASGYEISGDGTAIMAGSLAGPNGEGRSGIWTGVEDQWNLFPIPDGFVPCDNSYMSFYGMGGSGDYGTGLTWTEGCTAQPWVWDAATDTTVILPSINGESSRPNAITDDGTKIAGFNQKECGWRRGAMWVDGTPEWIDGLGENEAKLCGADDSPCCSDRDCPDYEDAVCTNVGSCDKTGVACVNNVCVGGATAGQSCYGSWNCKGTCTTGPNTGGACGGDYECPGTCEGGPNNGSECTGYCPDYQVCFDNPDYDGTGTKGEAYTMSADGNYIAGTVFGDPDWQDPNYDPSLWGSGYRRNPDGSFTQLLPPEGASPDGPWLPIDMSDDGGVIGGRYGNPWFGSAGPVLWTESTGTIDFQYFLVAQGLDDLYFWYLDQVNTVKADGTMVGGYGTNYVNPDCHSQYGCTEGWVAEIAKASVCHKGDFDNEGNLLAGRTLTVAWGSLGNHMGHGDLLGTCEFHDGGARAANLSGDRNSANYDPTRTIQVPQGTYGDAWTPGEHSVQQDDEASSAGPAVQREESRRRVRR